MAYPTNLDSFSTKVSGETIAEGHINDLQIPVVSIEEKLGTGVTSASTNTALVGTGNSATGFSVISLANTSLMSGVLAVANGGTGGVLPVANGGTAQTTTGLSFGGKTLEYTGDGNDNRTVAHGLGRAPILIIIAQDGTSNELVIWFSSMPAGDSRSFDGATSTIDIKSVNSTNVTLGTSVLVNQDTLDYAMFML